MNEIRSTSSEVVSGLSVFDTRVIDKLYEAPSSQKMKKNVRFCETIASGDDGPSRFENPDVIGPSANKVKLQEQNVVVVIHQQPQLKMSGKVHQTDAKPALVPPVDTRLIQVSNKKLLMTLGGVMTVAGACVLGLCAANKDCGSTVTLAGVAVTCMGLTVCATVLILSKRIHTLATTKR